MSNCGHGYVNTVSSPWKPRSEGGREGHRLQEGHKIKWVPAFLSPKQGPCLPAHKLAGGASVPCPKASLPSTSSTLSWRPNQWDPHIHAHARRPLARPLMSWLALHYEPEAMHTLCSKDEEEAEVGPVALSTVLPPAPPVLCAYTRGRTC